MYEHSELKSAASLIASLRSCRRWRDCRPSRNIARPRPWRRKSRVTAEGLYPLPPEFYSGAAPQAEHLHEERARSSSPSFIARCRDPWIPGTLAISLSGEISYEAKPWPRLH